MEKEFVPFVPYKIALALKELGFDEPCICCYDIEEKALFHCLVNNVKNNTLIDCTIGLNPKEDIKAPTFSQAFRWFREKYNLWNMIYPRDGWNYTIQEIDNIPSVFGDSYHKTEMRTYEEAEIECLKKLIEIVKKK